MGKLYLVATPIGNLEDITIRALRILKEVDLILAEDTRRAKILLNKYEINRPLTSYYEHTPIKKMENIVNQIKSGKNIALISEAGTPGISDPGQGLVNFLLERIPGLDIVPIPGPNAAVASLSVSGFPTDRFLYLGFLPKKKGRQKLLENLESIIENYQYTVIFYESPYRIIKTLRDCQAILGDREVVVCRELTKKFEEIYRGKLSEILKKVQPKGEFVVILKGK
jgi:16S rRNA (cytidine1402-2'-O)-methyltransferase